MAALKAKIGNHQGQGGGRGNKPPEILREVSRHENETSTIVAKQAGLGSEGTARRAKAVVATNDSERVAIMAALEEEIKRLPEEEGTRHGGDRRSEEFQAGNITGLNGETRHIAAKQAAV